MSMMETRVRDLVDEMIQESHTTEISSKPVADWPFANPYSSWLTVMVADERFVAGLVEDGVEESVYELLARVRSALSDWIAESKFAWGQLR